MADISYIPQEEPEDVTTEMEPEDEDEVHDGPGSNRAGARGCDTLGGTDNKSVLFFSKSFFKQCTDIDYQRPTAGHDLVEMFRSAVNNGTKLAPNKVMEALQPSLDDLDAQQRLELMQQVLHVASICQEAPHLFGNVLQEHLLGIIIQYLQDQDTQVRQMALAAVVALMRNGLLDIGTIEAKVCPVIEFLSYMSPDYVTTGISLMSRMAPLIGKELTERVFLDTFIRLCENNEFYIRKICGAHFGDLCAAVGKQALFQKLFPVFVDLCYDVVWGVRKVCVDVMMPVACCLTIQHRRLLLAEILATHLNDESKWVRMSAFQILGPFISTFAKQFTKITYNQQRELVFTSQRDAQFSIHSYEGIFPTKCTIRSVIIDTEEQRSKENFDPTVIIERSGSEENDEEELVEDQISLIRSYKHEIQKKQFKCEKVKCTDDTEKYNPFLYYYIPPDLPLDDELVEAARKSAAESSCPGRKSGSNTPTTGRAISFSDSLNEEYDISYLLPKDEEERVNFCGQDIVPQHLIDSFLSMAEQAQCTDLGADIPHNCAFSFPAVVLTLGRENWPYLKKAYQSLASANQWKVRRTLASSIHEIAIILGEELTVTDLVPIYDGFIKDLDEVRIGILKHLATFLKILKPSDRCQYLPRLKNFLATDNEWNWRFREELATQLLDIVALFSLTEVERHIVPLSLQLLSDKVAAVRQVALALVTQIVNHLSNNERLVTALLQELRYTLGIYAKNWVRRQTYVFLCGQLISSNAVAGDMLALEVLPSLLKLSWDKVPNVRLAVARTLSEYTVTTDWLVGELAVKVQRRLHLMRSDPDRDVRLSAGGSEHVSDVESLEEMEEQRNRFFE